MQLISFVTNASVNTRDHIELLLESLKQNLDNKQHQIIVFIDSDNENLYEYIKSIKHLFYDLTIVTHKLNPCIGYSRNNNLLVDIAKHDIVSYLQSDMVISPHYDTNILSKLEDNCILSSTRVEPPLHGVSDKVITTDFGTDPKKFDLDTWNKYSESIKSDVEKEYFFAPITFYKKVWQDLGGYDTLFRRSREDSDLVQRFVHAGVKLKQTFAANVYHFTCVSSRGKNWFDKNNNDANFRLSLQNIADKIELNRFIRKWGSFNHGESKLNKYDIDLVVKEFPINDVKPFYNAISILEPYVSRVWLQSKEVRNSFILSTKQEHMVANQLLNFSENDWSIASKFYNQVDYSKIFLHGQPESYNIKIDIDVTQNNQQFYSYLSNLHKIIEDTSEPGTYSIDGVILSINKVVNINPSYKVNNPEFDMDLLIIE